MTINEKLQHILSAQSKIRDLRNGTGMQLIDNFTPEEYSVIYAALEVAAAVIELFEDKRGR